MATERIHRRIARPPEEAARLKADRERYQAERPPVDELLAASGHPDTVQLGEYLRRRRRRRP